MEHGVVGQAAPLRRGPEDASANAATGPPLVRADDREGADVGVRGVVERRERVEGLGDAALAEDEDRGEEVGEVAVGGLVVGCWLGKFFLLGGGGFLFASGFFPFFFLFEKRGHGRSRRYRARNSASRVSSAAFATQGEERQRGQRQRPGGGGGREKQQQQQQCGKSRGGGGGDQGSGRERAAPAAAAALAAAMFS